jgi:hypothetical protein
MRQVLTLVEDLFPRAKSLDRNEAFVEQPLMIHPKSADKGIGIMLTRAPVWSSVWPSYCSLLVLILLSVAHRSTRPLCLLIVTGLDNRDCSPRLILSTLIFILLLSFSSFQIVSPIFVSIALRLEIAFELLVLLDSQTIIARSLCSPELNDSFCTPLTTVSILGCKA